MVTSIELQSGGLPALQCTVLYGIALYRNILHCNALHCNALHCNAHLRLYHDQTQCHKYIGSLGGDLILYCSPCLLPKELNICSLNWILALSLVLFKWYFNLRKSKFHFVMLGRKQGEHLSNPTKQPNITENLAPPVFQSGISDQMVSASSVLELEVKSLVSALKNWIGPTKYSW